jgi:hypothetical protein
MDVTEKRAIAEKVRRRFTKLLASENYLRSKPTFWVRRQRETVEFIHLHLFSFMPAFRAHLGIRVLNDIFVAAALNGPDTDRVRGYRTGFTGSPESIDECANELKRFCVEVGEPWFKRWRDPVVLVEDVDSPVSVAAAEALRASLRGEVNNVGVALSERLLGLKRYLTGRRAVIKSC